MSDFYIKREEFLKKISRLAAKSDLLVSDIRLHQLPAPGITLPQGTDPDTARKIMKIYNEVFR